MGTKKASLAVEEASYNSQVRNRPKSAPGGVKPWEQLSRAARNRRRRQQAAYVRKTQEGTDPPGREAGREPVEAATSSAPPAVCAALRQTDERTVQGPPAGRQGAQIPPPTKQGTRTVGGRLQRERAAGHPSPAPHSNRPPSSPKRSPKGLQKSTSPRKTKKRAEASRTGRGLQIKSPPKPPSRPLQRPTSPQKPLTGVKSASPSRGVRSGLLPRQPSTSRRPHASPRKGDSRIGSTGNKRTGPPAPEKDSRTKASTTFGSPPRLSAPPRLNLAATPPGHKGWRYQPPSCTATSGAFDRLGPPVQSRGGGKPAQHTTVGSHPRGQPRIARIPPSPTRVRIGPPRGKRGQSKIRPVAPGLLKAVAERRAEGVREIGGGTGGVFKSPVRPPRTPEGRKPETTTSAARPLLDLLQLFGESPTRSPTGTPTSTPPTPGKNLTQLPPVRVVIGKEEKQLAEAGCQSPLVRRRWRASRLSETSSEEEPVAVLVAEDILLEETSPQRLAQAAAVLERALP
ncbi:hypothetical protein DMENIID0001_005180 [Sergentomyia squamirostris]